MKLGILILALILASLAANAERHKLKTGEWLEESSYGWIDPLGRDRQQLLSVTFESNADDVLREQSLKELVTTHLLPTAIRNELDTATLLEKRIGLSLGVFKTSISEDWEFEKTEGWQWTQVDGPEIDWSLIQQEYRPYPDTRLLVPTNFLRTEYAEGRYNLILNVVALPETSPEKAMSGLVDIAFATMACDTSDGATAEYLQDDLLNGVYFYAFPDHLTDALKVMPKLSLSFGRSDGRWSCTKQEIETELESLDWGSITDWADILGVKAE